MHSVFFEFIELLPAMILKTVITDFFFSQKGFIIERKLKERNEPLTLGSIINVWFIIYEKKSCLSQFYILYNFSFT